MKVICINNGPINGLYGVIRIAKELIVGETYSVLLETQYGYHLSELQCDQVYGFFKQRFIPLSDIDETEFERNYIKEKV